MEIKCVVCGKEITDEERGCFNLEYVRFGDRADQVYKYTVVMCPEHAPPINMIEIEMTRWIDEVLKEYNGCANLP